MKEESSQTELPNGKGQASEPITRLEKQTGVRPNRDKQKRILRSHAHDICRVALTHIQCEAGRLEMTDDFTDFRFVNQS